MKKLFGPLVKVIFVLTRPLSGLVLHNSRRVRIIVLASNKILLQRSSFGHQLWSLPGGGIEKGENPMHAALRELKEETDLTLSESQIECIGEDRLPSGKHWPMVDLVFYKAELKTTPKTTITRPYEILELGWFSLTALPENRSATVDAGVRFLNAK
jgi:8-oxo-dGTP pyrophosphatase MutT (NUDIX family)